MKSKKLSSFILIVLTFIVLFLLVKDNYKEIFSVLIHANLFWIIIAIIFYILYLLFQTITFWDFSKIYDKNIKFTYIFYIIIVTNFFNGITPLASGGQPLQVYELHKKNISTVNATNIVIQNSIIYQISLVLWAIIGIIINRTFNLFPVNKILRNMCATGLLLNIILLLFFIIISFSKNFNKKLVNLIINIFEKIKLVKNKNETSIKWNKVCSDFYENSKLLLNNKLLVLKNIIVLTLAFSFFYSIPFFLAYAINCGENLTFITSMIICSYVFLSSNYLPIPGATGGMEYSFINYYKGFVTGFNLNSLLILWRIITYYLPTIIGGLLFTSNSIKHPNLKKEEI